MKAFPTGVLLAAGQSRRFGSNKLLHPIRPNLPMLFATLHHLREVLSEVIVVISSELQQQIPLLKANGAQVIVNEQASLGMGSSIACGVRASQTTKSGWLIALADMPYIQPAIIQQLAKHLCEGAEIVAPMYREQRGHPVGFSSRYKEKLLALSADRGARDLLDLHRDKVEHIQTSDQGVILDIDSMADLSRTTSMHHI